MYYVYGYMHTCIYIKYINAKSLTHTLEYIGIYGQKPTQTYTYTHTHTHTHTTQRSFAHMDTILKQRWLMWSFTCLCLCECTKSFALLSACSYEKRRGGRTRQEILLWWPFFDIKRCCRSARWKKEGNLFAANHFIIQGRRKSPWMWPLAQSVFWSVYLPSYHRHFLEQRQRLRHPFGASHHLREEQGRVGQIICANWMPVKEICVQRIRKRD